MKKQIKVTLEYVGGFTRLDAHEYKIVRLGGAPNIETLNPKGGLPLVKRVGDIIDEKQAKDIATFADVTTLPKSK